MTDRIIGFTAKSMPKISWHGEHVPCVKALVCVRTAEAIDGRWAVLLDHEMRVDDAGGILEAAKKLGVTDLQPFQRGWTQPGTLTAVMRFVGGNPQRPLPPGDTMHTSLSEWFAQWELYDRIRGEKP